MRHILIAAKQLELAKTRLGPALPPGERIALAEAMFRDVLAAAMGGGSENDSYSGIGIFGKVLVGVAPPVREIQLVAFAKLSNRFQKAPEVGGSVHQGFDLVPVAPGQAIRTPPIKSREVVTSLGAGQKRVLQRFV